MISLWIQKEVFSDIKKNPSNDNTTESKTVYLNLHYLCMKWDRPHRQYHYIFGRRKWLTEWKWCMVSASFNVMNKARDVLMSVFRARDVDLWDIIWFSLFLKMSLTLNKKAIYQQTEGIHISMQSAGIVGVTLQSFNPKTGLLKYSLPKNIQRFS